MDNQEANAVEEVPEVNSDDLKNINADLKELIQFLKDESLKEQEIAEAEKQLQIEAEDQQKILDEEERLKIEEQQKNDLEKEQSLIDSETEFRTQLLETVTLQNEKIDTYISQSDGLAESVNVLNENASLIVQNTEVNDLQKNNETISYYSGLAILVVVMIFIPSWIMVKFFSSIFRTILKGIL